jgi:hypothetical protein
MRRKKINFILMLIIISLSCVKLNSTDIPKMLDTSILLKAYGFDNGIFEPTQSIASGEDYLTIKYFSPSYPHDEKKIKIIREELPNNRVGALKIFSMWHFRSAYNPESKNDCIDAIKDVKEWLQEGVDLTLISPVKGEYKIPPMTFTDEEIVDYYSKAIRNKIEGIALKVISSDEAKQLRELLITYCVAPTKEDAGIVGIAGISSLLRLKITSRKNKKPHC